MGGKPKTENSKKVAGNARKAEAAAQKQSASNQRVEAVEAAEWDQGAKSNKKKEDAEAKKAEAAAKKAERERLLAEEESTQRSQPKGANKKTAEKKTSKGLDLSQLDDQMSGTKATALNASGIDNALDALELTGDSNGMKIDRHPERRFKAAYKAYEDRRLPELEQEHPGLRKQQRVEMIRKEFEKSPENPFNQAGALRFDSRKDEVAAEKERVRSGVEQRLGEK